MNTRNHELILYVCHPITVHVRSKKQAYICVRDDVMAPVPPQVEPHPVSQRQQHGAADAGHLAAVTGKAGAVYRSQALPVLECGPLSPSARGHVHGKVVAGLRLQLKLRRGLMTSSSLVETSKVKHCYLLISNTRKFEELILCHGGIFKKSCFYNFLPRYFPILILNAFIG